MELTNEEEKIIIGFIQAALANNQQSLIANTFIRIIKKDNTVLDSVNLKFKEYVDGNVVLFQSSLATLDNDKTAKENDLNSKISLYSGLSEKL